MPDFSKLSISLPYQIKCREWPYITQIGLEWTKVAVFDNISEANYRI